jgi:hypothetical protein
MSIDPCFPIGKFAYDGPPSQDQRKNFIEDIEKAPAALRAAVGGLSPQQIETPYRQGGWTVRQVVHHVPESHMNAYIRFKLALTEQEPTIKPYEQQLWAELEDWKRSFRHPEMGVVPLEKNLALYAWHGRHHVAHITELRRQRGW